jgi:hypothetical protein
MMHNKFCKADPKQSINAVCAQELGKPCALCELEASDKQLRPALSLMLPVYVYRIGEWTVTHGPTGQPEKSWTELTYKNAEGSEVRVQGLRIIELKQYGTITAIYQTLRTYYRDYPSHDIRECDFSVERVGSMQNTSYIALPRAPKAASQEITALIPTVEAVRDMLLSACKPHVTAASMNGSNGTSSISYAHEEDDAPDF